MPPESVRLAACLLVGAVLGLVLGPLFVPDPTGVVAAAAALTVGALVAGGLYRSGWLADG